MNLKITIWVLVIIAIILICINLLTNKDMNTVATSNLPISTKKIEWGIKRSDSHKQPDLGTINKKLIDENEGIAIGNSESKSVYLTFDEGYEAGYSAKILDVLKENKVPAAFFITGHYFNSQPELVGRMIKEGHIIGNHTVNHYSMPDLTDKKLKEEVTKLHIAVYKKFNYEMTYIRPPMGEFSQRTLNFTKNLRIYNCNVEFCI